MKDTFAKRYLIAASLSLLIAVLILLLSVLANWRFESSERYSYSYPSFPPNQLNLSSLTPYDVNFTRSFNVFLDAHSHTKISDGRMSPAELVDWGIASGFNAMIITDHNTVDGGLAAQKHVEESGLSSKIVVFPGMEYTSCRIHLNLLNINETVPLCRDTSKATCPHPTDDDIRAVIDRTHELGGLVSVNHLPWSLSQQPGFDNPRLLDHPSLSQLLEWGVDYVEVINEHDFDMTSTQFARENGMGVITGSDVHEPRAAVSWTVLQVQDTRNREEIWDQIKQRRTSFLFYLRGNSFPTELTRARETRAYEFLAPVLSLGQYAYSFVDIDSGMYSFQGPWCQKAKVRVHGASIVSFCFFLLLTVLVILWTAEVARRYWKTRKKRV